MQQDPNLAVVHPGEPAPSWWRRNRKWVIPVIVLVVLLAIVMGALVVFGAIRFASFIVGSLKSSGGYQQALTLARENPDVTRALGTPIDDGWFPTGSIDQSGSSGSSDLSIPISGPEGKGTLYVTATRSMGTWELTSAVVEVKETGQRIDLLAGRSP